MCLWSSSPWTICRSIRQLGSKLASPDSTLTTMSWNRSLQHLSTCGAEQQTFRRNSLTVLRVSWCDGLTRSDQIKSLCSTNLLMLRRYYSTPVRSLLNPNLLAMCGRPTEAVDLVELSWWNRESGETVSVKLWINGSVSVLWTLMYVICNFIVLILSYDTDRRMDTVRVRQTDARWSRNVGILSFESIFSYPFFFSVTFTNIIPYVL